MTISEWLTELLNAAIRAFNSGQLGEAERGCRQTLAAVPHSSTALMVLGAAISHRSEASGGTAWLARAACVAPDDASVYNTLGNLQLRQGDEGRATTNYRRAIALAPDLAHLQYNLGNLFTAGAIQAVGHWLRRATTLDAGFADAWASLANSGEERDGLKARAAARRALAIDPAHAGGWVAIGNSALLLPARTSAVIASLRALAANPRHPAVWTNLRIAVQYDGSLSNDRIFSIVRRWGAMIEEGVAPPAHPRTAPVEKRPLRVGYLSADLRSHVVSYNVEGLLTHHDRAAFEIYLYAEVPHPDEVSRRLARTGIWRSTVGLPDADVASLIRSDTIDILVCLAGHTSGNRLSVLAHRPAPLQLSFHDISSSGLVTADGWITDWTLHPVDTRERFTEALLRLPTFYLHVAPDPSPDVGPPPFLANGHVTFGSFNSLAKVSDEVLDVWAHILSRIHGSKLHLGHTNQLANHSVAARVAARLARAGIARERLFMVTEPVPRNAHLARLSGVDIALDTFPYNGSTATFEALWMGVPVVTLAGDRFISRVGASMLHAIAEPDLIADTIDHYTKVAVELARDRDRLTRLRRTLRGRLQASPLCDAPSYARSIEALYRRAWQDGGRRDL
jgi:predicted O-linked N-acetylglucosamine transferase (SPINDLY family)